MLRLAHRIATTPADRMVQWAAGAPNRREIIYQCEILKKVVETSPSILIDNVAEFYAQTNQDEFGLTDFPTLQPPLKRFFCEWVCPTSWMLGGKLIQKETRGMTAGVVGVSFVRDEHVFNHLADRLRSIDSSKTADLDKPIGAYLEETETILLMETFIWFPHQQLPNWMGNGTVVAINKKGRGLFYTMIPENPLVSAAVLTEPGAVREFDFTVWQAISFLNCKNVARHDVTSTEGPSAKWLRRQKAPEIRYHVLNISPMKEVLRTEGGIEHNGLKNAMHICRGHYATYTEDRPLFGRAGSHGTFWIPDHVRGNAEHGIVDKDYRVNAPKPPETPA